MERFPAAQVVAGAGTAEFIAHPKAGPLMLAEDAFMSKGLAARGVTPGRPPIETVPDLSGVREVPDTAVLDLGGIALELFPVKGHSPAIFWDGWGISCSVRTAWGFISGRVLASVFTGAGEYLDTQAQIQAMAPAIVCPGHQGPLQHQAATTGIQAGIDATRDFIERAPGHP